MEPELDQDRAFGHQAALKGHDLGVGPLPLLFGGETLDPFDQDPAVPGAVEDGHAPPAREVGVKAPKEMVPLLPLGRRGVGLDPEMAGVEPGDEALDRPALTRSVPALEHDGQGRAQTAVADEATGQEAEMKEPALEGGTVLLALRRRHLEAEIDLVKLVHIRH